MIPLYPPTNQRHGGSMPSIKWRSLMHLVTTPSASRHVSLSNLVEQQETTTINTERRPSAPAILHDLRARLPTYMRRQHRKKRSTSVVPKKRGI